MPPLRATAPFVGLNTQENESLLAPNEATEALNINLNRGTIKRRDGWSQVSSTSGINTGEILGIYDFRRASGGASYLTNTLIKAGTSLWNRTDSATANIGPGAFTAGTLADFATFEDIAYIADTGDLKSTNGAGTFDAVITRPSDLPHIAVTAHADGELTGTFSWKYTWYSPTYKQESPASNPSIADGTTTQSHIALKFKGDKATLSNLPDTKPDARDNDSTWVKRIYRRNHTLGQTQWLLVGTASRADTTFVDNVPEHLVSNTDVAPYSSTTDLEGVRNIEEHGGVMFMAKDDCRLFFSKPQEAWSVTDFISIGGDAERGKITGLLSWKGLLYIFKEDSIWTLDGLLREDITTKQVVRGVGCYSGHSIVSSDEGVYFLGEDNFYVFDGQNAYPISDPITSDVIARNRSNDLRCVGVSDQENGSIIWTWSTAGNILDKCYVYFKANSQRVEKPSWAKWEFSQRVQYLARVTTSDSTADKKVWYGFNDGDVGESNSAGGDGYVNDSDDGERIESIWRTGKIDGGEPTREKAWATLYLEQEKQSDYSGLRLRYYRNGSAQYIDLDEIDPRNPIHYLRIRERARDLQLEIYHLDEKPIEISNFTIDLELAGIHHGGG